MKVPVIVPMKTAMATAMPAISPMERLDSSRSSFGRGRLLHKDTSDSGLKMYTPDEEPVGTSIPYEAATASAAFVLHQLLKTLMAFEASSESSQPASITLEILLATSVWTRG
ncbi:MAG: hypothetical protein LQ337_007329 [Flavoplaca oasis]|nr:MAG: hypothetical protein LQ337_007329 [Flavoplaca oasis]